MKIVKGCGLMFLGLIQLIICLFLVLGIVAWAKRDDSIENLIQVGSKHYGREYFQILHHCARAEDGVRVGSGKVKVLVPEGTRCWVLSVTPKEATRLGFPAKAGGGQTEFDGVPGIIIVTSNVTMYDELSQARILAHEAQHLRDFLDGYPQSKKLELERRAWRVSAELFLKSLSDYGISDKEILQGVCPITVPLMDCKLGSMLLEGDEDGFREIIAKAYLLP